MRIRIHFAIPLLFVFSLSAADDMALSINRFTVDTYRDLSRGSGNLILSPFNISACLSMAAEGARGKTADEMAAVLHRLQSDPNYAAALALLTEQLTTRGNSGANQFLAANGLWVQQGFDILPDFRQMLLGTYHASLRELDFARNAEQARREINSWTGQHTHDRIRDLFAPGTLGPKDRMVLTSAIYFYGKWKTPFATKDTKPAPFYTPRGGREPARFMNRSGKYGYGETASLQILEMPYGGTGMAFDILLPKDKSGLPVLETAITADDLAAWLRNLSTRTVEVAVPKFRAESEFSLRQTLTRLGMPTAFSGAADFSGIDGRRDLAISDVKHKAFVDVAEEGTEAAAATGTMMTLIATREGPIVFRADHPFLFLIRDTQSGTILFAGRLAKP